MQERIKRLEGSVNLRDIGGYQTADGRTLRWGLVLRSGSLTRLTDRSVAELGEMGVSVVYDLRSAEEVRAAPDKLPNEVVYRHRPIVDPARFSQLKALWAVLFKRNQLAESLFEGYTRVMIDGNAQVIGEMLTAIADADSGAILIHCTAGKDRTGLFVALLLCLLGVPLDVISADYSLSNQFYDLFAERLNTDLAVLRRLQLSDAQIKPLLTADPQILRRSLTYLTEKYGSVEQYLVDEAKVAPQTLEKLKAQLLTG
ncbi:MAG: tyrosine-protein phosphatase [Candidatus Promineifilaceae bacterium]